MNERRTSSRLYKLSAALVSASLCRAADATAAAACDSACQAPSARVSRQVVGRKRVRNGRALAEGVYVTIQVAVAARQSNPILQEEDLCASSAGDGR